MIKIAINGFGRIGRLFFRQSFGNFNFEIIAINDLSDIDNLVYLLKYDSVYGQYNRHISSIRHQKPKNNEQGELIIDNKKIKLFQEKDPAKLPWGKLGIDIVIESTGAFESFEKAKIHLDVGAKKVLLTAPAKDADGTLGKTILMGINEGELKTINISSNASCTTNAVSPIIAILSENPGIEKAILNTVHAYTATQAIVDSPVKGNDFRRGRAGAQNIIPSTTGAAKAVTKVIKGLDGKFDGIALRVPVVSSSIADITFVAKRKTSIEEINNILRKSANSPQWKGILKITEDQIVSSDVIGEPYGAIVDLKFTKVIDGDLVKILSWYDNEAGYVSTLIKHVENITVLL